jgi:hypothetical protein
MLSLLFAIRAHGGGSVAAAVFGVGLVGRNSDMGWGRSRMEQVGANVSPNLGIRGLLMEGWYE